MNIQYQLNLDLVWESITENFTRCQIILIGITIWYWFYTLGMEISIFSYKVAWVTIILKCMFASHMQLDWCPTYLVEKRACSQHHHHHHLLPPCDGVTYIQIFLGLIWTKCVRKGTEIVAIHLVCCKYVCPSPNILCPCLGECVNLTLLLS